MRKYKEQALAALKGNWGSAVLINFIALLLGQTLVEMNCALLNFISVMKMTPEKYAEFSEQLSNKINIFLLNMFNGNNNLLIQINFYSLIVLLFSFVTFGLIQAYSNLLHEGTIEFRTLFGSKNMFVKGILLSIRETFFIFLWMLLFIIPGIIKSLSYSMSAYLMTKEPELSAKEAMNLSKELMHGQKLNYFLLKFSFIGWMILGALACGIGIIFVYPYLNATCIAFYDDIYENYLYGTDDREI